MTRVGWLALLPLASCACERVSPVDTELPTDDAPLLQALHGDGFVALWTDRVLGTGERIERIADGETVGEAGDLWIDLEPGATYRWVGPGGSAGDEVEPAELSLTLSVDAGVVAHRGEGVQRELSWDGALLDGLPVGLTVERDGELWLEDDCADGLPCWRDEPVWWARWDDGADGDGDAIGWTADEADPVAYAVQLRLELIRDELGWPLASIDELQLETGRALLWGDVHTHGNLSGDGCEDIDNSCLPWGDGPDAAMFAAAEEAGLDFLVLTDHAEHATYLRMDQGTELSIHAETLRLAAEAEGGPVIPIVGFEWTGVYDAPGGGGETVRAGGHRTVVFDGLEPCEDYWVGAGEFEPFRSELGFEDHLDREARAEDPQELLAHLAAADAACEPVRHTAWFHHPGVSHPRPVAWDAVVNEGLGDTVVEIHSEHGSSECHDADGAGCDWSVHEEFHHGDGSVQAALQLGHQLGFVGGTDSHDGLPGSLDDGPSAVVLAWVDGALVIEEQTAAGSVTGALAAGASPDRVAVLDAIEQRHTLATSWLFDALRVAALGADGLVYLPGDAVPAGASPLELFVEAEDAMVERWRFELWDPWHELWAESDSALMREPVDIAAGDVRYVRIRAWIGEDEQRAWASPFFGID